MAITTVIKHDKSKLDQYTSEYNTNQFGYRLKLLSVISLGKTDGTTTEQTITENGNTVIVSTRTWNDQVAAQDYCTFLLTYQHPSVISAEVVIV
jgi:hypothetical protein